MTYDSPITCSTGKTSNITIEDDIVNSYITSCENHYVLVKDSDNNNYCGMYTKNTFQAHLTNKTNKIQVLTTTPLSVAKQQTQKDHTNMYDASNEIIISTAVY
jgi:hypothetical protein